MTEDDIEKEKETTIEEAIEELLVDPDAPAKGNAAPPPQTIEAESDED